jgi:hypothetical protein|tara:strand:- start:726 stop:1178 length:453 start_codon:yes stop_codon:yes gene_type:complete
MTYTNGKWVLINPALNFSENSEDQYSPEVWIVNDGHDTFDLPPELAEESTEYVIKWDEPEGVPITGKDRVYLRDDAVEVWKGGQAESDNATYIYTFTDKTFDYVIHETLEFDGDVYFAITRVRHHFNEDEKMQTYLDQIPVVDGEVIDND